MKRFTRLQTVEVDKIKGSRFIVTASPIVNEDQFKGILSDLQKAHPNANHHCWAWRLSAGGERSSDDGEPSGSAGEPILQRMRRAELIDSMVVVTRYFGGTKLGVGGLVRAYGGSAAEVISEVSIQALIERDAWTIAMAYSDQSLVKSIIASLKGEIALERYTHEVYLEILTDPAIHTQVQTRCVDRTAGRVSPVFIERKWIVSENISTQ